MKRSEMVGKIADVLSQFFSDSVPRNKIQLMADVALYEAEREGMKPPTRIDMADGPMNEHYDNEWESET